MPDEAASKAARAARVLNEVRGGTWGSEEDRDAAARATAAWPAAKKALRWHDGYRAAVAEDAVRRGMTAVVFGAPGYPTAVSLHGAAAEARTARLWYASADPVVAGQRGIWAMGLARSAAVGVGDPQALLDATGLIGADGRQADEGPWQVQWGLAAVVMDDDEAGQLAACYRKLLPPGSEVVIAVPVGRGGDALAVACGGYAHTAPDVRRWCGGAGLKLDRPPYDVRSWGRQILAGGLRGDGGRIIAAVARVP